MRRNWHDLFVCQTVESTIDVEADQDVEQFMNAFTQGEEPKPTSMNQDWNATPREGVASQSCNQPEVTSPAPNSAPPGKFLQESTSPYCVGKPGRRTRGPAKTKSPAVKERDELLLLDLASATPPGSAREVSSSSEPSKRQKRQKPVFDYFFVLLRSFIAIVYYPSTDQNNDKR